MFQLKPDFEQVLKRFDAWWNCEVVDRALVSLTVSAPQDKLVQQPVHSFPDIRSRWLDTDYVVKSTDAYLHNNVYLGEAIPVAWPNLGPEVFSSFYGCEIEYGESTAWSKPVLKDWSDESLARLKLDRNNFYFQKLVEMTDAMIEAGRGKYIVGYSDLHGGGDAVAAFRDPQELLIDTIECPDRIRQLCDSITPDFLETYDFFHEKLSAAGNPSTTWCQALAKGKFFVASNDFSCMIADDVFEELFIPGIIAECRHMDRSIYHLDGPQALRYLDRLLEIPEIHAIQWVPGAGRDNWADWIDVYRRIQQKNKAMEIVSIPAHDLDRLFEVLNPEGVWINHVSGITNMDEADAALRKIAGWTRKS